MKYLLMVLQINESTENDDELDLARFIVENEHPVLDNYDGPYPPLCNKDHGPECNVLHSDVQRIAYAAWFKENEAVHWRKDAAHRNLIHYTNLEDTTDLPMGDVEL